MSDAVNKDYHDINYNFQLSDATIITVFCICIAILLIHVWLRPYKLKGLNILDGIMLLTLLLLMIGGANTGGCDDGITIVFFILPLLLLVNYLALNTKLKYILIPGSCIGVITTVIFVTWWTWKHTFRDFSIRAAFKLLWSMGIFHIYIIIASLINVIAYIIWVVKYLYTQHNREGYLRINVQDDNGDDDNDSP